MVTAVILPSLSLEREGCHSGCSLGALDRIRQRHQSCIPALYKGVNDECRAVSKAAFLLVTERRGKAKMFYHMTWTRKGL